MSTVTIYSLDVLLPYLEPVGCSMSSFNCCFQTCIQVSQKAGQLVWFSHFFQNFTQFIVIHSVKGFGIVNKAEIDVFLELFCCFDCTLVFKTLFYCLYIIYLAVLDLDCNMWTSAIAGGGVSCCRTCGILVP